MLALPIEEHLDVIEDIRPCSLPVRLDTALDPLPLEQLEKAFRHRIVVTVSPPAHAGYQVV
jgi:hypothetical protein